MLLLSILFKYPIYIGHGKDNTPMLSAWFLYKLKGKIWIINIYKTLFFLRKSLAFIHFLTDFKMPFWFIELDKSKEYLFKKCAFSCGEYACTRKWIRGYLSNYKSIQKSVSESILRKNVYKSPFAIYLRSNWIMTRFSWPRGAFISNVHRQNEIVCKEGSDIGLPIIGLVDTNVKSYLCTYPLLSNDDNMEILTYFITMFATYIQILKYKNILLWYKSYKQFYNKGYIIDYTHLGKVATEAIQDKFKLKSINLDMHFLNSYAWKKKLLGAKTLNAYLFSNVVIFYKKWKDLTINYTESEFNDSMPLIKVTEALSKRIAQPEELYRWVEKSLSVSLLKYKESGYATQFLKNFWIKKKIFTLNPKRIWPSTESWSLFKNKNIIIYNFITNILRKTLRFHDSFFSYSNEDVKQNNKVIDPLIEEKFIKNIIDFSDIAKVGFWEKPREFDESQLKNDKTEIWHEAGLYLKLKENKEYAKIPLYVKMPLPVTSKCLKKKAIKLIFSYTKGIELIQIPMVFSISTIDFLRSLILSNNVTLQDVEKKVKNNIEIIQLIQPEPVGLDFLFLLLKEERKWNIVVALKKNIKYKKKEIKALCNFKKINNNIMFWKRLKKAITIAVSIKKSITKFAASKIMEQKKNKIKKKVRGIIKETYEIIKEMCAIDKELWIGFYINLKMYKIKKILDINNVRYNFLPIQRAIWNNQKKKKLMLKWLSSLKKKEIERRVKKVFLFTNYTRRNRGGFRKRQYLKWEIYKPYYDISLSDAFKNYKNNYTLKTPFNRWLLDAATRYGEYTDTIKELTLNNKVNSMLQYTHNTIKNRYMMRSLMPKQAARHKLTLNWYEPMFKSKTASIFSTEMKWDLQKKKTPLSSLHLYNSWIFSLYKKRLYKQQVVYTKNSKNINLLQSRYSFKKF